VTILILLVFVVFLWVAVLAPSAWRRFGERQGVGSIDHFHHQLQLLEHAGPKTVAPAYRLHTAMPGGGPVEASGPAVDSSRPKLVLLRPTDDAAAADVDDGDGAHYERIGVLDRPEPACVPEMSADLSAFRREQARRRCTMLLRCLCGVAISTGLIGMWPGMHLAWIFTVLSGLAALGLVGLMAYAKELEAEQRRHRSRHETARGPFGGGGHVDPAMAGYPGGWDDDDYEEPRVVAR
jgi:membrane protein implicated in regulation of membrane protease activity